MNSISITQKPIVFLAFANERQADARYLRNLPQEARRLRETLDRAAQVGLCEVVERPNAILQEILDVFQDARYRHSIAIFHYGGHADGYRLLLESTSGAAAAADAGGLAAFLGQQTGLKLVFLNSCSTQPQVEGLLAAGVPAVIATAQAIDDAVATEFAGRFYHDLAQGANLCTAFNEAAAAIKAARGSREMRALYYSQAEPVGDRWPWELFLKPGAEAVTGWNLPEAADDPLFGLLAAPALPLPARNPLPQPPVFHLPARACFLWPGPPNPPGV